MPSAAPWTLFCLLLLPLATAAHQGPDDLNFQHLNVLVYHPYPDEQGDPWGIPGGEVNGTQVDWMQATYGAFWYPTAVFDGLVRVDQMTQGEGGGEYTETHAAYEGAINERLTRDAPVTVRIQGALEGDELVANVTVMPDAAMPTDEWLLRVVYIEDDVMYNGGSGIVHHRFVVRGEERFTDLDQVSGNAHVEHRFHVTDVVDRDNVGVVAVLQNFDEDSQAFAWKEVLQSATWLARQQGETVQSARGVLLELYSATWCTACVIGDAVTNDLTNAYGVQSTRISDARFEYLRPGDAWKVAVAAIGAIGFVYWVRRQRPPEAPR